MAIEEQYYIKKKTEVENAIQKFKEEARDANPFKEDRRGRQGKVHHVICSSTCKNLIATFGKVEGLIESTEWKVLETPRVSIFGGKLSQGDTVAQQNLRDGFFAAAGGVEEQTKKWYAGGCYADRDIETLLVMKGVFGDISDSHVIMKDHAPKLIKRRMWQESWAESRVSFVKNLEEEKKAAAFWWDYYVETGDLSPVDCHIILYPEVYEEGETFDTLFEKHITRKEESGLTLDEQVARVYTSKGLQLVKVAKEEIRGLSADEEFSFRAAALQWLFDSNDLVKKPKVYKKEMESFSDIKQEMESSVSTLAITLQWKRDHLKQIAQEAFDTLVNNPWTVAEITVFPYFLDFKIQHVFLVVHYAQDELYILQANAWADSRISDEGGHKKITKEELAILMGVTQNTDPFYCLDFEERSDTGYKSMGDSPRHNNEVEKVYEEYWGVKDWWIFNSTKKTEQVLRKHDGTWIWAADKFSSDDKYKAIPSDKVVQTIQNALSFRSAKFYEMNF